MNGFGLIENKIDNIVFQSKMGDRAKFSQL